MQTTEKQTSALRLRVFADIDNERNRQDAKWGKQNHNSFTWLTILTEEVGEVAQSALHDEYGGHASGTLRDELIQVAAVATQWIELMDEDCFRNE